AVRYDGSACLNVRSVTSVCKLLSSEPKEGETISMPELASILWFVETCVTSKNVYLDGTVPAKISERAQDEIFRLKTRYELKSFDVSAIAFSPDKILRTAGQALAESRLLIDHFSIIPGADVPLDQAAHQAFLNNLNLACSLPAQRRDDLALQW